MVMHDWMTSRRNVGESRSVVQTLFYGLRKSRKNALPVATFPRCDITMSHVYLIIKSSFDDSLNHTLHLFSAIHSQ